MKRRMQQPACENLMSGLQQELKEGLASNEYINPSDFRKKRGFLYCHLTQIQHGERMDPKHAAHGSPWHRKAKAPAVFCGYKGSWPWRTEHSDAEAEVQFEDIFPKASHALGNLTESGNRWICKGQGCRAAGAVITNSDIRPLIHNERRALGAEAGTSPMLEDNRNIEKWCQVHP